MKTIAIPIREFALPTPRVGSIDAYSGYGRAMEEGIEVHLRVQARRESEYPEYKPEVLISREFERDGYTFKISGRMDGFFDRDPAVIEEIKSTFNVSELLRRLADSKGEHPYCLQTRTYGYFHFLESGKEPRLRLHLASTRSSESYDYDLALDRAGYEEWLGRRLDQLVDEARKAEKRAARRKKLSESFPFPFERPRPGQEELIRTIEEAMSEGRRLLVQAPTGLGKTAGVLYPSLREALARGQRVIYVTPKNSQHSVAEDAIRRFQETGTAVKSLTITAKAKICFKNEPLCNPEYCEYAKDHYTKVDQNQLLDALARKKSLKAKHFRELGEEHQVCPFELQMEAAREADAIICDYNYVFSPRAAQGKLAGGAIDASEGKPNLVIDEAHNLPSRAMDYFSPALSSIALEKMREEIPELPARFRSDFEGLLDDCLQTILSCKPPGCDPKGEVIEPHSEPFLEQDARLRQFLSRYLESDVDIKPRDVVLRLSFYWSEFASALEFVEDPENSQFFTTFHPHSTGGTVRITCCDASGMLEPCFDEYQNVVGFSATLRPFEYYARLSGLLSGSGAEKLKTAEFASPFRRSNRKLLVIPQVSTKYSERERNAPRIADAIRRISMVKPGNYFAFFPSFEFMERVLAHLDPPPGFAVIKQEREMKASAVDAFLDHLRSEVQPTLVFAVQGGVFSEGVDYPGGMIIGAFVIGPPLPSFDLERERMRGYYEEKYGKGFDYAYTFPAMAKAVQAAGRVIRSETDRGLIVLMDNRFLQASYNQSMPRDWFDRNPQELVSSAILKDVEEFWNAFDYQVTPEARP